MKNILYSSGEVRQAVVKLFESSKGRRVAISAFVGNGAEVYLGKTELLEIYCWPKPGSTNPNTLRKLIKKGAGVFFSDALHMKVYWTEDQGAIITSANLSTNALGSGNLKEIGILLESEEIDIDRIIHSIKPICPASEEAIRKLDVEPRDYYFRNPGIFKNARTQSYREWYESPWRQKWKLALISGDCKTAAVVKEILKNEYEFTTSQLEDIDLISAPEGLYKQGDWILVVEDKDKPTKINWLYADRSIQVPKTDKKAFDSENSYQTFQVHPRKFYSSFPFDERDSKFKLALRKAIKDYGANRILDLKTADPPESLLKLIMDILKT